MPCEHPSTERFSPRVRKGVATATFISFCPSNRPRLRPPSCQKHTRLKQTTSGDLSWCSTTASTYRLCYDPGLFRMTNPGQVAEGYTPSISSPSSVKKPIVPDGTLKESFTGSPSETCLRSQGPKTPSSQHQSTHSASGSSIGGPQHLSRKLSPTASTFRPCISTGQLWHTASGDLRHSTAIPCFLSTSNSLSTNLGLSRRLMFTRATGNLMVTDVQGFLEVRSLIG